MTISEILWHLAMGSCQHIPIQKREQFGLLLLWASCIWQLESRADLKCCKVDIHVHYACFSAFDHEIHILLFCFFIVSIFKGDLDPRITARDSKILVKSYFLWVSMPSDPSSNEDGHALYVINTRHFHVLMMDLNWSEHYRSITAKHLYYFDSTCLQDQFWGTLETADP